MGPTKLTSIFTSLYHLLNFHPKNNRAKNWNISELFLVKYNLKKRNVLLSYYTHEKENNNLFAGFYIRRYVTHIFLKKGKHNHFKKENGFMYRERRKLRGWNFMFSLKENLITPEKFPRWWLTVSGYPARVIRAAQLAGPSRSSSAVYSLDLSWWWDPWWC